jgi:hypothetical protein
VAIGLFNGKLAAQGLDVRLAVIDRKAADVAERSVTDGNPAAIFTVLLAGGPESRVNSLLTEGVSVLGAMSLANLPVERDELWGCICSGCT